MGERAEPLELSILLTIKSQPDMGPSSCLIGETRAPNLLLPEEGQSVSSPRLYSAIIMSQASHTYTPPLSSLALI